MKSFCTAKKPFDNSKDSLWETTFANDMTDKGLIFKIYTQLIELNILKSRLKNRQKT